MTIRAQDPAAVLLAGRGLGKTFASGRGVVRALDGVDVELRAGETLGLVGESGCGKTTLSRCLVRLETPTDGSIHFDGADITRVKGEALRRLRRQFQIVFQDPSNSLDPRMTVGQSLTEGLRAHHIGASRGERRALVVGMLEAVGLHEDAIDRYVHSFSGGQQQRIGIARALLLRPRLLVADEPVASLDVSVQAQILNLLVSLKKTFGLTMLFVAHDLAVVAYISDRIAVMYLGRVVEVGGPMELVTDPQHPYTAGLLAAVPNVDAGRLEEHRLIQGDLPSAANPPSGCRFHPRCPIRQEICERVEPPLAPAGQGRQVACHFPGSVAGLVPARVATPAARFEQEASHAQD